MYIPNESVVRLVGLITIVYRICIAAYWILYSEFGLVSCIDFFSKSAMTNLDVKEIEPAQNSGKNNFTSRLSVAKCTEACNRTCRLLLVTAHALL